MKLKLISILLFIIVMSGCLFSTPPKSEQATQATIVSQHNISPTVVTVSPTPNTTELKELPKSSYVPSVMGISTMAGSSPNITIILEVPITLGNNSVTLLCNNTRYIASSPNITSESYSTYVIDDVACTPLTKAWVLAGGKNISSGIPRIDGRFTINIPE